MIRHRAAAAALILALSIAPAALAAEQESEVDETLTVASTISAVVPASATYVAQVDPGLYRAEIPITDISTDFPVGLSVHVTATPLVGPGATVPVTDRAIGPMTSPAGWTETTVDYGTASIVDALIASVGTPVTDDDIIVASRVRDVFVPGTYTGTLTVTVATNG